MRRNFSDAKCLTQFIKITAYLRMISKKINTALKLFNHFFLVFKNLLNYQLCRLYFFKFWNFEKYPKT